MAGKFRFAEGLKVLPILGPIDTATSAVSSAYVDLKLINWASFLVQFGNLTSDSTDTITVTVECSTAQTSNAGEQAIAFSYRLAAAVATDTMGAITAATSSGVAVTAADDNKALVIDLDPAAVTAQEDTQRWVRLTLTPDAGSAISLVSACAILEPRYPGNSIPSST